MGALPHAPCAPRPVAGVRSHAECRGVERGRLLWQDEYVAKIRRDLVAAGLWDRQCGACVLACLRVCSRACPNACHACVHVCVSSCVCVARLCHLAVHASLHGALRSSVPLCAGILHICVICWRSVVDASAGSAWPRQGQESEFRRRGVSATGGRAWHGGAQQGGLGEFLHQPEVGSLECVSTRRVLSVEWVDVLYLLAHECVSVYVCI
jgi:hypothetical protein